ncbi:MAG: VOC family protein [Alcanivoracaceae bacterium]|nr:VOC family protein [Alcanivoracaceae bacterium]
MPKLQGIDHVHVYVQDMQKAENWYAKILGFKRVKKYEFWNDDGGPLTLEDSSGIHLALFKRDAEPDSNIAFKVNGEEFMVWKTHIQSHCIELSISNHSLVWSMYFKDPFDNLYEITTWDYEFVKGQLGKT